MPHANDDHDWLAFYDDKEEEYNRTFTKWERLLHRCKTGTLLKSYQNWKDRNKRSPSSLSNGMFVSLCACFADEKKREILKELFLDLIADDLAELLAAMQSEVEQ